MKASEIRWSERKSADGRVAKVARLQFDGIGWQQGGRISAMVEVALVESEASGKSRWVLKWQPPRSGLKPITTDGEAGCLYSAELCLEEAISAFATEIETWTRQYAGISDQKKIGFKGFRQA